jgi:hypothetical protein
VLLITLVIEQYVQWRFGVLAGLGLALLSIGLKTENATCAGIGGLLIVAPAMTAGS